MTDKILYWATVVLSGLALLLFLVNTALIGGNQDIQAQIAQKQNVINVASSVAPLNQQLSQALFDLSQKTGDAKIRDLLTSQGFKLPEASPKKGGEGGPAPTKAPPPAKKAPAPHMEREGE